MTNWNKRFMDLARYIAQWSKYPGRKVGAVIVDTRHTVISMGYNGLVRKSDDSDESKYGVNKYLWSEHAERNAIYNASQPLIGLTIYSTLFPCADCARAIIQTGMVKVVSSEPNWNDKGFAESFKIAHRMLKECEVAVDFYKEDETVDNQGLSCGECYYYKYPEDFVCVSCNNQYSEFKPLKKQKNRIG